MAKGLLPMPIRLAGIFLNIWKVKVGERVPEEMLQLVKDVHLHKEKADILEEFGGKIFLY